MEALREKWTRILDTEVEQFMMRKFHYLLQMSAVFMYMRGRWFWFSMVHFLFFLSILLSAIVLTFYTTILIKDYQLSIAAQTFHIAGGASVSFTILVSLAYNREKLAEIFTIISCDFYKYDASFDERTVKPWLKELESFKRTTFVCMPVLLIAIGLQGLFFGPMEDSFQGTTIEHIYINDVYMQLPVPFWFPFAITDNVSKYLCLVYLMFFTSVLLLVLCSGILIIFYLTHSVNIQLRILNSSVQTIEHRAFHRCMEKNKGFKTRRCHWELYLDSEFMKAYELCIKENLEHHNVILRAHKLIDHLQKWPMFTVVFFMSLVLACGIFTILKGETRIAPQLFSFLLLILELIGISVICWRGQELTDQNYEFFRAFYQTKWFDCSESVKKSIFIIQERNKAPLTYKAGGFNEINWELFGKIMNTAYSYFNVMRAMKENEIAI